MALTKNLFYLSILSSFVYAGDDTGPLPIVLWHGMGDNCCHSFSMGSIKEMLEKSLPGVHVQSLMIGSSPNEDTLNGFFKSVDQQIDIACALIKNDTKLQNG